MDFLAVIAMKGLIDTHAHLTYENASLESIESELTEAQKEGLTKIINICTDAPSLEKGLLLANKHPWIYNTAGIHPHDADKENNTFFSLIEKCAAEKKIIAIGEIGLDYFYHPQKKESQLLLLKKQIELAKKNSLPLIIHCREAFSDFFELVQSDLPFPAVVHCFTGTKEDAQKILENNWYISFSGIITFPKSTALQEIVKQVPLEKMLIETDSPFLAPQKYRGKKNKPSFVIEVAKKIAELKQINIEKVISTTTANTKQLFEIEVR